VFLKESKIKTELAKVPMQESMSSLRVMKMKLLKIKAQKTKK
jgi:hypothetical protein